MSERPRRGFTLIEVLVIICLGRSHSSLKVHEKVIKELEGAGPDCPKLAALRKTARPARNALLDGNFTDFGKMMIANTKAQADLHPDLVSQTARDMIAVAKKYGAIGWKVNGAGGEGGSLTILGDGNRVAQRNMIAAILEIEQNLRHIPTYLSRRGLRVW